MIPQFPERKKLELSDGHEIEAITQQFPPYSDYDFISMWSYDTDHLLEISKLHNNLVLRFQDYIDLQMFYTFLGKNRPLETIGILLSQAKQEQIKPFLKMIPHASVESVLQTSDFTIQEDRDDFDYIIDASAFVRLDTPEYHTKRKLVRQFIEENSSKYEFVSLAIEDTSVQQEIIDLFRTWMELSSKNIEESAHELHAIEKLFTGLSQYSVQSYGIRIEGKLVAYIVAKLYPNGYAVLEFGKWDRRFRGIGEFLQRECVRKLEEQGCKWVNYEQDLGIAGLRTAKELCHPVRFLKKYRISST